MSRYVRKAFSFGICVEHFITLEENEFLKNRLRKRIEQKLLKRKEDLIKCLGKSRKQASNLIVSPASFVNMSTCLLSQKAELLLTNNSYEIC